MTKQQRRALPQAKRLDRDHTRFYKGRRAFAGTHAVLAHNRK
jgi:hypothetical protein